MRKIARTVLSVALVLGFAATIVGFLAPWWPAAEILNHFRPFAVIGSGLLLALSLAFGFRSLAAWLACLFAITLALLLLSLLYMAPKDTTARASLRVVTLNTWANKAQADAIIRFLEQTQADIILLQEIDRQDRAAILARLQPIYPQMFFDQRPQRSPAILSKQPWLETGVLEPTNDRAVAVWARFEEGGQAFEVASVHTGNPFKPEQQATDIDRLIEFVRSRRGPIIMGGDFNLTPFSWKLTKLAQLTGLKWAQVFSASWPANRFVPIVLLDHILLDGPFALVKVEAGSSAGSDHLPVIADLHLQK